MQRFYIQDLVVEENSFVLSHTAIVFQLVKVLRSKVGDNIILFDGKTMKDFVFEIREIGKRSIILDFIEEIDKNEDTKNLNISLYQALPNKLEKIEYIIQKGVEVGISAFYFYRSERSQKLILSEKKELRLEKIMLEAVEQSGRNIVPKLEINVGPADLQTLQGMSIFLHTKNSNSLLLKDYINLNINLNINIKIEKINIFIGPEGGFSESEVDNFEEKNFTRLYLGSGILRTETAGVVTAFTLKQML